MRSTYAKLVVLTPKNHFYHIFQCVVTCGLDSYIIVWDPWNGRRLLVIKEAHTQMLHGEIMSVEITAATFDPGYQRLLTGAHDGTLKVKYT